MGAAIEAGVSSTTAEVIDIAVSVIPVVMVVFAGLIALGMALRLIKKLIGRKGA